jgi:hypothetical protein
MPLYLVRWPSLHASLVRARDEDELLMILDEVADPGGCTFQVYRGPLWIDLELPFKVRDVTPDKPDATDPSDFTVDPEPAFDIEQTYSNLRPTQVVSDTSHMMSRKMLKFAFPNFAEFLERRDKDLLGSDDEPREEPYPEALRAALVADLWPLVRHLQAQKAVATQEGIEAEMMRKMRVTSMLPSMRDALRDALKDAPARKAD